MSSYIITFETIFKTFEIDFILIDSINYMILTTIYCDFSWVFVINHIRNYDYDCDIFDNIKFINQLTYRDLCWHISRFNIWHLSTIFCNFLSVTRYVQNIIWREILFATHSTFKL